MKRFIIFCLIAFMVCSCDTTKNKMETAVIDYVSYLTEGGDFTITDMDYYEHSTITNYEEYKTELKEVINDCEEEIEKLKEPLSYSLYAHSLIYTKQGEETVNKIANMIKTITDIKTKAEIELSLSSAETFTPKYTYHCEYKHKGRKNSIWLLLEYVEYEDKYKVHLMTNGYFNMEP